MKRTYDFKEIFKLRDMLDKENIKYTFEDETTDWHNERYTSYHIWCFDGEEMKDDNWYISIIQNYGSYGREQDLLEIMGLLTTEEQEHDSVVGYLTAEDVFNRIKKHLERGE